MMRKDQIAYRDEIAKTVADLYRELGVSGNMHPQKACWMVLLCQVHEMFCRQLDQSFFEPVNAMAEMNIIEAIRLLRFLAKGTHIPDAEIMGCIAGLERILPKEPAEEERPADGRGE